MPLRRPAGSFKTPPEWINARYAARALSHGRPLEIAIYAVSVLYSPGPVNLLALKAGLRGPDWRVAEYCLGVGLAMFTCFALLGLAGSVLVRDRLMPWLLHNAGYDPAAAVRFMRTWGPKHGGWIFRKAMDGKEKDMGKGDGWGASFRKVAGDRGGSRRKSRAASRGARAPSLLQRRAKRKGKEPKLKVA